MHGCGLNAFFTTKRLGGDVKGISAYTGIDISNIYLPIQRHTDKVIVLWDREEPRIADAVITRMKDILIGVVVADCVPVLLYDPDKGVVGAVHAGWRGTASGILKKAIDAMVDTFYSDTHDIRVAFGPSIRWCCYHVGYEVIDAVSKATGDGDYYIKRDGAYCLDLQTTNRYQAVSTGILEENIWLSTECTYCYPDRFYSYRYSKGPTGRQGGFTCLRAAHRQVGMI